MLACSSGVKVSIIGCPFPKTPLAAVIVLQDCVDMPGPLNKWSLNIQERVPNFGEEPIQSACTYLTYFLLHLPFPLLN